MLVSLGYTVHFAHDGWQALSALEDRSFDAVLMDCHMPEMNGLEATAELRRREHARAASGAGGEPRRIPVIALTAAALPQDRTRCLAAGMDDFLAKPIDVTQLQQALARHIPSTARSTADQPDARVGS